MFLVEMKVSIISRIPFTCPKPKLQLAQIEKLINFSQTEKAKKFQNLKDSDRLWTLMTNEQKLIRIITDIYSWKLHISIHIILLNLFNQKIQRRE